MTDLYLGDFVMMNGSRRGFDSTDLTFMVAILVVIAAAAISQILPLSDPPAPAVPAKSSVQSFTGSGQWGGNIFVVDFDGHLLMVSSAGGILHHPDCACLKGVGDE